MGTSGPVRQDPEAAGRVVVEVRPFVDGGLLMVFDGKSRNCYLAATPPTGWKLIIDNKPYTLEQQRDATKIFTPSNGKIIKYLVPNHSRVKAGTPFVECEIMKMILPLICDVDGVLHFPHDEGTVLQTGELVARVELADPSAVKQAKPNRKPTPAMAPPRARETKPHLRLQQLQKEVDHVLLGYYCLDVAKLASDYLAALADPLVALSRFQHALSEHKSALPAALKTELSDLEAAYEQELTQARAPSATVPLPAFPAEKMTASIQGWAAKLSESERGPWLNSVAGLSGALAELAEFEPRVPEARSVARMLAAYFETEDAFEGQPHEVALMSLRDRNKVGLCTRTHKHALHTHERRPPP